MTRRCRKSLHNHHATQRDNHARRIIRRRIKGRHGGYHYGLCMAWYWRTIHGGHCPVKMSERCRNHCLISVRQALHNPNQGA